MRNIAAGQARPAECECILSPEDQWRQLFLLQYPEREAPDLASFSIQLTNESIASLDNTDYSRYLDHFNPGSVDYQLPELNGRGTENVASGDLVFSSIEPLRVPGENNGIPQFQGPSSGGLASLQVSESEHTTASNSNPDQIIPGPLDSTVAFRIDETFFSDVQSLRERVHLLEQRLSYPNEREQDLEMVLANVWQALVRTGSADAQPESPIWRLVRRFAGNTLSSVPANSSNAQPAVEQMSSLPSMDTSALEWQGLFGTCPPPALLNPQNTSDSGYGSLL